jgi:hypothetical protein
LRRRIALLAELGVPRQIGFGIRELGLIARAVGRELLDLCLKGTGIDFREQVAGLDGLPFLERDPDQLPWIWLRTTSVL